MFPIINFSFYILLTLSKNRAFSKIIGIAYICILALFLATVKQQVYNDDFFGYYEQYVELIRNNYITYYSDGKEFVLTLIFILLSQFYIENQIFFSFCIKLINFLILFTFIHSFLKKSGDNNQYIFILIATSPNFLLYSDSFIRQSLSLCFILLSVAQINMFKRTTYFVLACATHLSNLIYIPILIFNLRVATLIMLFIISFLLVETLDYQIFSTVAEFLGMGDKLLFIDNLYLIGEIDTKPSITTYIPTILIISYYLYINKSHSEINNRLINLFLYTLIAGNLVANIPYASSRITMLTMIYTPVLFILLRGWKQTTLAFIIYLYLWGRFLTRENPTMELNYHFLIWPFNYLKG